MSTYFKDPTLLTKKRLQKDLRANGIPMPDQDQSKAYYVRLYRHHLSSLAFESEANLLTQTEAENFPDTIDDEQLRNLLVQYGISAGPITASTRRFYKSMLKKQMSRTPEKYDDEEEEEEEEEEDDEDDDDEEVAYDEADYSQTERTDVATSPGRPSGCDDSMELRQRKVDTTRKTESRPLSKKQKTGSSLVRLLVILISLLAVCIGVVFYFMEANPPRELSMKNK